MWRQSGDKIGFVSSDRPNSMGTWENEAHRRNMLIPSSALVQQICHSLASIS
jgi:hypothetical protein